MNKVNIVIREPASLEKTIDIILRIGNRKWHQLADDEDRCIARQLVNEGYLQYAGEWAYSPTERGNKAREAFLVLAQNYLFGTDIPDIAERTGMMRYAHPAAVGIEMFMYIAANENQDSREFMPDAIEKLEKDGFIIQSGRNYRIKQDVQLHNQYGKFMMHAAQEFSGTPILKIYIPKTFELVDGGAIQPKAVPKMQAVRVSSGF